MSSLQQVVSEGDNHPRHEHSVQLFGADERALAARVGKYIAEGLQRGEGVLVIAVPEHAAAFVRQLHALGSDADRAIEDHRLLFLDAENVLDNWLVDGKPDELRFEDTIGSALSGLRGVGKRAYGEVVGVLWERGERAAAIRLEEIWNTSLSSTGLRLICGYPIDVFSTEFQSHDVDRVLRSHTHLLPTGQDGDLDRAIHRAIQEVAPAGSETRLREWHSGPPQVSIPQAEKAIFALNAQIPSHAQEVLVRARQYYQTEKRFRALIENSSDAILLGNPDGELVYASPSTSRVLGYSAEEIMGRRCLDLVHPDDREHAARTLAEARANRAQPVEFEARLRRRSGDFQWVESIVTDLSDEPAVGGIVWNCRDITQRKTAEQAIRQSERRLAAREGYLQALLDSMPECVKVLDRNGEVLEMNAAGLRMLQADSAEQVIGKSVYPLIDESDREAFQSLNESVFDGGAGGCLEFSVNAFKGAHPTFETRVVPLRDESDHVIGALSATRDITERKMVEAALRHANEGLEQFAYAAAHDLQEPIRNVSLYTELLAQRYRDRLDDQASEFMSITVEGARRMQALVRDLLTYTRSLDTSSDEQPSTDANEVIAEVLANLRTAIETCGAEVFSGDLPNLPIHRAHLVQLLQNLVGNALKYKSEKPPRIEISAVETPLEYVVAVRDNGIGIPADQCERIFGVFKRLHGRNVPGNGIGLAICHRIIFNYAGRIWVESEEGHGSKFMFTLPRR